MSKIDYLRTSSLDAYEGINLRRTSQRDLYNRFLIGHASRSEVGQEYVSDNPHARPPSWTQHHLGKNHSYVIPVISASEYELSLNAFRSGNVILENTAVPATGTMYYEKSRRFNHKIYKLSASALLSGTFNSVSGNYVQGGGVANSIDAPYVYRLNVPDSGRIRDIKVWVEIIHVSATFTATRLPLSGFSLSLRSPNVRFGHSHPIWNVKNLPVTEFIDSLSIGDIPVEFYRDTYVLWEGADQTTGIGGTVPTWDNDRHMRTIFSDGASILNPRHLDPNYSGNPNVPSGGPGDLYVGSPNNVGSGGASARVIGNDYPWFTDARIQDGGPYGAAGSPPKGWLTGPATTADVNEFPTTGSNFGPEYIRPHYPLLDDIEEVKITGVPTVLSGAMKGFRPGLRGSEMKGDWELLVVNKRVLLIAPQAPDLYFRQFRLEITYDQNRGLTNISSGRGRKNDTVSSVPVRSGQRRLCVVSGNTLASRDTGVNFVFTTTKDEYGRSIGISDSTGSIGLGFAIFTRITGTLADRLSGSTDAHTRYSFLHNEFGTPYIPLSSGSGITTIDQSFVEVQKSNIQGIEGFTPPGLKGKNIRGMMSRTGAQKSTRDLVREKFTGSL